MGADDQYRDRTVVEDATAGTAEESCSNRAPTAGAEHDEVVPTPLRLLEDRVGDRRTPADHFLNIAPRVDQFEGFVDERASLSVLVIEDPWHSRGRHPDSPPYGGDRHDREPASHGTSELAGSVECTDGLGRAVNGDKDVVKHDQC
jgi:hypothetical protein